ncbi:MAG: right-handed parallel beta-helix repeat-containing protein, partial [Proteobacteria bacterium]|nr:right-handed parallel beta-helix repeat-containing protein [Pseudomonadota bacterium]
MIVKKIQFTTGLFFLLSLLLAAHSFGVTQSGALLNDENWSGSVVLTGDVIVPLGITLTIEAGTTVKFPALVDDSQGGKYPTLTEIIVNGTLISQGSGSSPVLFTSESTTAAKGDWGGIIIESSEAQSFSYTTVEYATTGIEYHAADGAFLVTIEDSTISNNSGNGVALYISSTAQGTVNLNYTHLHDNTGKGVYVEADGDYALVESTLTGNEVNNNGSQGISLVCKNGGTGQHTVTGNTVYANSSDNVYCSGAADSDVSAFFLDNIIHTSAQVGIYLNENQAESFTAEIKNNTISSCSKGIYFYHYGGAAPATSIFENNKIHSNNGSGVEIYARSSSLSPVFKKNTIVNNAQQGTYLHSYQGALSPEFFLNTITGNAQYGVNYQATGAPLIYNNDLQGNTVGGVYLKATTVSHVLYNSFSGNEENFLVSNNTTAIVDARYNSCGSTLTAEMAAGDNPKNISAIFDIFDDSSKGSVAYVPWLDSEHHLVPTPISWIVSPVDGLIIKAEQLRIKGIASSLAGIERVEVSTDNGQTWAVASGTSLWYYDWTVPADGTYILQSRIVTTTGEMESPTNHHTVTIDYTLPTTSGSLTEDETWTGVVTLTGDVTIPAGMKLTVEPGTTISFQSLSDDQSAGGDASRSELIVNGELTAIGTEASPITFTSTAASPARGDWGGISAGTGA